MLASLSPPERLNHVSVVDKLFGKGATFNFEDFRNEFLVQTFRNYCKTKYTSQHVGE